MIEVKPIKTEQDYELSLARLGEIFNSPIGSKESDEADILALLIEAYEDKNYSIDAPDPIEAIKIRMEELGLRQLDLIAEIGGKSRVSEVLNKKRRLTVQMIRNLTKRLGLSAELLIQEYKLVA